MVARIQQKIKLDQLQSIKQVFIRGLNTHSVNPVKVF